MATFCIHYEPGPNWIPGLPTKSQHLLEHGRYLHELLERGQLLQAGPFPERGGMALVECGDEATALVIAAQDPAVSSGVMVARVHAWRVLFDQASGRSPFSGR
ncbi:MAG: YciI family protein [Ramlibacter sp.]|nr:YciI family protein [Ramlibacter sp.]